VRYGNQTPTFEVVGPYDHSAGERLCDVYEKWGTRFYPCQRHELTLFMARDEENRFASKTICISKPRQNGKSFGSRKYAITMGSKGKHVLYSAHNGSTVRKMFKHIADEVDGTPELAKRVKSVYRAAGTEGIYFHNGGCIEFQTRTNSGARGETYDVIIIDEAQELTYDQLDAIKPTTLASESGDPQMIFVGTPPNERCSGDVFADYHEAAHAGKAGGMWWMEWSVDEIPDLTDRAHALELAYRTNPAMGYRIREDVMLDAIESYVMKPDSFAREYLGRWNPSLRVADFLITQLAWNSTKAHGAPTDFKKLAYGVRFTPDGRSVTLAMAATTTMGCHVEYIRTEPTVAGIAWLVDWIVARKGKAAAVAIDGRADATDLGQQLMAAGMPKGAVMVARTSDAITADAMLVNAVNDGTLTHLDDPALAESALGATRRPIGKDGGYGFGGECPERLDACALALWAARTTKRDPRRRGRIG
jgi:hypothetical protein